jgi:hypothetical protein
MPDTERSSIEKKVKTFLDNEYGTIDCENSIGGDRIPLLQAIVDSTFEDMAYDLSYRSYPNIDFTKYKNPKDGKTIIQYIDSEMADLDMDDEDERDYWQSLKCFRDIFTRTLDKSRKFEICQNM